MKIALFNDALPCSSRCNASWSTEKDSPTPPLKPSNSIEGAALSEQQISLQMSGLSLLYWTLLYVNAAGHKWLFVQSQKEQHCVCDTYQSLECQWWPINEGLGQRRGRLGHSIRQISSLMSLNVAPSDMTCIRLWHTQIAKRRQDLHYAANSSSWNNCLFLLCLLLCNAGHCHLDKGDTHESHNCTHTFTRDSLSSLSLNVAFTVLFFLTKYLQIHIKIGKF